MEISALSLDILNGDRRALARAITLIESTRADHRLHAIELLKSLRKSDRKALRIGLSGTPGVGKSTFIEAFGLLLLAQGLTVAVLAIDPSSTITGGSILGDKTRMELLSREKNAFIRPSPSQTELGGVARRTRESIALCEAAGFDIVLVETVGVGQSETLVADMTDILVLLLAPAGGDELQGVKRGIMEVADLIIVNKADGALKNTAIRTCADYSGALRLMRKRANDPADFPKAMIVSSTENVGLTSAWAEVSALLDWRKKQGIFTKRRHEQNLVWFRQAVNIGLQDYLRNNPSFSKQWESLENLVLRGKTSPDEAAQKVLDMFINNAPRIP